MRGLLKALVLPPGGLLILGWAGWLLRRRRPRTGNAMLAGALAGLTLLSMPACGSLLRLTLESTPPLRRIPDDAQAIVVLGGDVREAPEYGGVELGPTSLSRLRYAARLQRDTGLPLLVTGGVVREEGEPVGELMARALRDEFGAPARWIERESRTTAENARFSAPLLREAHVHKILLVTSSFHMPRAAPAFEAEGLEVVPAPVQTIRTEWRPTWGDFLPQASGLLKSTLVLHEWFGRAWYALARRVT